MSSVVPIKATAQAAPVGGSVMVDAVRARLPQSYETARQALAKCEQIDECQGWADKHAALASYARQAEDEALLRHAMRIQGRAIRRAGELLKEVLLVGSKAGDRRQTVGAPLPLPNDRLPKPPACPRTSRSPPSG